MHAVLIELDTSGQPDREAGLKHLQEVVVPGVTVVRRELREVAASA